MKVAKQCGVDHGAVSRYFKQCKERDFFTDKYEFTELGKASAWLSKDTFWPGNIFPSDESERRTGTGECEKPD